MNEIIKQEKSDEEITSMCNQIINKLENFNRVEKYRVISILHNSLLEILKQDGIIIEKDQEAEE